MLYLIHCPLQPSAPVIDLPASKSLSNRALILKGMSGADAHIDHLSDCDDTAVMIAAFSKPSAEVNIGAAGTSMRFLTAYLASTPGVDVVITGSERMKHRPIQVLVDALQRLGAQIDYAEQPGFPPLAIHGRCLEGGDIAIDGSVSSQYISALLMIAPRLTRGLRMELKGNIVSVPYIHMTLGLLREFGIESQWDGRFITIAPQAFQPIHYVVESDWSAASYWYELVALGCLSSVRLLGLKRQSWQGDAAIASYFEELGVRTHFEDDGVRLEPCGAVAQSVQWDLREQPDLAQTLITTCAALGVHFDICGLQTLRIKETDRISALEVELHKLGFVVSDADDSRMTWHGEMCPPQEHPVIATYEDHRMAMAFAPLASIRPDHSLSIDHPEVVSKSYPAYWKHLEQAGFSLRSSEE